MKIKILIFFALLFSIFAQAIELHPESECESLKANLQTNLSQYYSIAGQQIVQAISTKLSVNTLQARNDFVQGGVDYALLESIDTRADEIIRYATVISNQTVFLQSVVSNVVCSACPVDSNGDSQCCEDALLLLQDILSESNAIEGQIISVNDTLYDIRDALDDIYNLLYLSIGDITNQLAYTDFLLEHGFLSATNELVRLRQMLFRNRTSFRTSLSVQLDDFIWRDINDNPKEFATPLGTIYNNATFGYLDSYFQGIVHMHQALISLNNYAYDLSFRRYPILTNTVGAIHRDITNFFSFFRGEIGVQGVLSDWQSEQVSGSYHDFLTNHYLTVVRGGPLTGNQSSKTNWFARIETLLAALVFTDSAETNTVDTSAGNQERQQLSTVYETANGAARTFNQSFQTSSQSIIDLYRSFFTTFDTATMPSHIVLMRFSANPGEGDVEVSFQSDAVSVLVEGCRVVSTFCWASVGIFLLYRFLVWAARCVVATCQFIYRLISAIFK